MIRAGDGEAEEEGEAEGEGTHSGGGMWLSIGVENLWSVARIT